MENIPRKCCECGDELTLEMEFDLETCVTCLSDKWPTEGDIQDARSEFESYAHAEFPHCRAHVQVPHGKKENISRHLRKVANSCRYSILGNR